MPDTDWITETPLPDLSIFRRVTLLGGPDKTARCHWAGAALRTGRCHSPYNDNTDVYSFLRRDRLLYHRACRAYPVPVIAALWSVFRVQGSQVAPPGQSDSPDNTPRRPITARTDSPKQLSAKPDNGDRLCSQVGIPTVSYALVPIWSGGCCTQALSVIRTDYQYPDWLFIWGHTSPPTGRVTARVTNPPILLVMEFVVYH